MAIEGYLGRPGSGKSYSLTHLGIEQADRGRPVFSNYPLTHPNVQLFGPDDLLHLPPGLILLDEAHLWFPSRGAMRLPPSWLALLSQTRKRGWDLYWTAQHPNRVDAVLKDVSCWFWDCSAWLKVNEHAVYFRMDGYEPENFRKPKKRYLRKYRRFSHRIAGFYDTMGSIEVAKHAQSKNDAYDGPKAVA